MVPRSKGGCGEVVIKGQDQTEKWQQQRVANSIAKGDDNRDGMLLEVSKQEEGGKCMYFGRWK